jgi:hypothetical protein
MTTINDESSREKKRQQQKPTNVCNIKKWDKKRKKESIRKVPQTYTQAFG